MCKCTPNKRTPFCGAPGCEWPKQKAETIPTNQRTAKEVLEIYRANRTAAQEIALIEFMELSEQERMELLFFGSLEIWHMANAAMKAAR